MLFRSRFEGTNDFVAVQEIVEHNLDDLFPGMEILKVLAFRVTRNAEIERDSEDTEDLLEATQHLLKERRFARVVRLEIASGANPRILKFLMEELQVDADDVFETEGLIDYGALNDIADTDIADLHWPRSAPLAPQGIEDERADIFEIGRAHV